MPKPLATSLERVAAMMSTFGITLRIIDSQRGIAMANLNGAEFVFMVLQSTLVIRSDRALSGEIPALCIATNSVNNSAVLGSVTIVNRTTPPLLRAEVENPCAAGLTDKQLRTVLETSINTVFKLFDAFDSATRSLTESNALK
ncbi:YbjN domain-containing protein [Corynebacterium pseudotuberculosis]|uniref:YbjN domain-containing protein n=1 Tax=Corynebacterium pseudotuberculosis TaxID=1719 RepID=UPI0002660E9B|nr:YbjN domain-containing protein [Corynebacterium pseudotuberculosis]AFM07478.1 hypothetical protein CP162_05400 [Corynebacterium pseudotuberculosis Cp162]WFP66309.1 YbjN domain-containing protein [Corynebacterium pseudotuberculosis]